MQDYLVKRKAELQQEYNNLTLQKSNLSGQLKACRERMAQLRGVFAELETLAQIPAESGKLEQQA